MLYILAIPNHNVSKLFHLLNMRVELVTLVYTLQPGPITVWNPHWLMRSFGWGILEFRDAITLKGKSLKLSPE